MKKRILSILLLCCMVLTMLPAPAFAADEEAYALPLDMGGLCEHHPEHDEACGYTPQTEDVAGAPCGHLCEICESGAGGADPVDLAGASGDTTQKALSGEVSLTATQYTYTLHYDANGGSGAPPSQSVTSSEYHVWVPISEIIPTRDGYTFMGWANYRTGKPIYGGNGGYTSCLVVHGYDMSTTIYAIWEVHNHSWGEWTPNGNGTHKRTCNTDSSHTETGSCSGGKATSTERAVCETCHAAYGELLQPAKTVITTPPTLRLPAYIGNEYTDAALMGGEAKTESTGVVVLGTFSFKYYEGGRVHPGENNMVILFTPKDTEAYTTAECIITVMGTKRTITRVPDDVIITDKPLGTAFGDLGLPSGVKVETNTGASYSPVPVTWDGSTYNPNKYGEQIITGELHVERSRYTDHLEPTSTVKATARIRLIDNRVFTPTLEPPVYSKQLYGGDLCFLVFADKYLSGGTATANGEPVSGKFTLDKDQKIYGHSLTASTLLQAGQLQLKVIFTPDNLKRYTKAECTVDVNVIPRKYMYSNASYIDNRKIGTPFAELNLSDSFSFYAVGDEKDPEGTGMDFGMNVVTSWDASTYNPNSFEEQTIYGEVNRAELEKYFTIPESTDLRAVRKVQLQPDPVETEITQVPVFHWRNGNYTLPDNTIFTWRKLQVGTYNAEVGTLVGGAAKVKGADTVAPGTFSFKNTPPFYLQTPGEHDVTVVFTPDDPRLHKPTETTIKISAIKNTIRDTDKPDPITDKPIGTSFAALGLPKTVCINAVDDAWRWINVAWDASSYDAQSPDWQIITGTLLLDEDDDSIFQQPEPAVTAAIRVKLTVPDSPPTVTTETLPGGTVGTAYSQRLSAQGTTPITWSIDSGDLPADLSLNEDTGEISGTPTAVDTATFTVKAENIVGSDTKELSITIAKPQQYGKVSMDDYVYGETPSTPSLTDRTGNGSVTYYYSTTNSNSGGTTWENIQADTLNAGTYYMYAELGKTENYGSFTTACVKFRVLRAMPTCTKPTGLTAIYGQTLADVTLPDGWSWMNSSESVGNASTAAKKFMAKFTPTDTDNYNMVENIELEVTVNKADGHSLKTVELTQKHTDTSEHTYTPDWSELPTGQTWSYNSEYSVSTGSHVTLTKQDFAADGSLLTYAISGGKAGDKITLTLKASCDNYGDFTITLNITLTEKDDQKPLTITGADSVVYGQALTLTATGGSGTGAVTYRIDTALSTGEATIDPNTGVLTPVKVGSVSVIATKAGDNDYNDITSAPFVLMIKPATPTGAPNYTKIITSGKTLKDAALTTNDSTLNPNDGKLEWVDDKGNVLPDSTRVEANKTYKWRFTPTDTNYTTLTGEIELYHKSSGGGGSSGYSYYTIKATAGTGGSISPSGSISVREGRDQTFTITPDRGYAVSNVKIDGRSIGAVKSYTFENVKRAHTIEVSFTRANEFIDVPAGSYYYDAVLWAVENGITTGASASRFDPNGVCTRAQAVTFLWRAAGSPKPETRTMPFTDVLAGSYYYDAVLWAVENGITKGTSDTTFSPDATCSRAQIVAFLWRSEKSPAAGTANPFADVKSTAYYAGAVLWAVKEDVTKGTTNTTFSPDANCTRAQIVTFIWRCKK